MNALAADQLIQVLEKTISPDQNELKAAQHFLETAAQNNLPELIKTLSDVLYQGGNSPVVRQQAGVQLKNFLYTNDESLRAHHEERWLAMSQEIREYTKNNVLKTLGTESFRPSAAAQCIQLIAMVELPRNMWPILMSTLVQNITNAESTASLKECTLQAIGYICQDVDPRCMEEKSNEILTAIVHVMRANESSNQVKLAATNALLNLLEFTRVNFEKDAERHFIMQVVCEATQSTDVQVKVAALQCLVKIMPLYYQYMETYMGQALFAITMDAMKSEVDEVALQGIEFWSDLCDEEVDLQIEASEAMETGRPPEHVSRFYAKGALPFLVPAMIQSLCKQAGIRGHLVSNKYQQYRKSACTVQTHFRNYLMMKQDRSRYVGMRQAAIKIQKTYRGFLARKKYLQDVAKIVKCQNQTPTSTPEGEEKSDEAEAEAGRPRTRSRRISGVQPDLTIEQLELAKTPAQKVKERSMSSPRRKTLPYQAGEYDPISRMSKSPSRNNLEAKSPGSGPSSPSVVSGPSSPSAVALSSSNTKSRSTDGDRLRRAVLTDSLRRSPFVARSLDTTSRQEAISPPSSSRQDVQGSADARKPVRRSSLFDDMEEEDGVETDSAARQQNEDSAVFPDPDVHLASPVTKRSCQHQLCGDHPASQIWS
eukprot:TRINITY_DN373_c0_g1_i17.p1 TRINITY_DN373_c0_g1~~TRINITY_DN373_c0_g1_i17.p1  ORF type:complete len:652 (-),score=167.22 TRINITY_DN373_c0_g1_i17:302-2257(-)